MTARIPISPRSVLVREFRLASFSGALGPPKRSFSPFRSCVQRPREAATNPKEAEVKRFTSYLVVVAAVITAFAPVAQAADPAVRALQIRGQGMDALCASPT